MGSAGVFFAVLGAWVFLGGFCGAQKPNSETNRRHDVYIAGFFPFGRGVENSDTGECFFCVFCCDLCLIDCRSVGVFCFCFELK